MTESELTKALRYAADTMKGVEGSLEALRGMLPLEPVPPAPRKVVVRIPQAWCEALYKKVVPNFDYKGYGFPWFYGSGADCIWFEPEEGEP